MFRVLGDDVVREQGTDVSSDRSIDGRMYYIHGVDLPLFIFNDTVMRVSD